jgi:hypothetical protein
MTEMITVTDLRGVMKALMDSRPQVCWPHAINPRYTTWTVVLTDPRPTDIYVPCANLCGGGVVLREG